MQIGLAHEQIMDNMPVAEITIGPDHKVIHWNRAAEVLTRRKAADVVGTDRQWEPFYREKRPILADLIVDQLEEDLPRFYENHQLMPSVMLPGAWEVSGPFLDRRGKRHLLHLIACPVYDHKGKIAGAVEIIQDMTNRVLNENAMPPGDNRYKILCDHISNGMCLLKEGRFILVNQSFMSMFGYDREADLLGKDFLELIRETHHPHVDRVMEESRKNVEQETDFQAPCLTKNGLSIWVEGHFTRIPWDGTRATLIILRDITEGKLKELSMEQEKERLSLENIKLKASIRERYRFGCLIGKSPAMQKVYEQIISAAGSRANVIIYGESGTGKELVAREIHDMSERRGNEFVTVHCGAIPETLMESEFFGHRKGAFTGAYIDKHGYLDLANRGTLLLDEVGELGLSIQVKLLRAIEGGGYTPVGDTRLKQSDIRIIAATNRDLMEQVNRKAIRPDFFYRIHVLPITLPPLRERKEDIPLLVEHFMALYRQGEEPFRLPEKIMETLFAYNWPGNVRELQNVIQRYLTEKKLDFLPSADLPEISRVSMTSGLPGYTDNSLNAAVEAFEKRFIEEALKNQKWKKGKAADALGVSRKTLFRKMKQYGLNG
ncbi:MAG: sigma 54-interacting transcriptional regulator [Syntrophales bacterium]|jgi:PAS domain S-box-containing protein|nr:sigma 54-interacting transcriptional regulator [Syntrophales bacterium]